MSDLTCSQCSFENDSTRVFCHNCGARLGAEPASAVPPGGAPTSGKLYIPPTKADPRPEPARRPVPPPRPRGTDSRKPRPSLLRALISTAILGAALAAIIQMFRAPDGLPPAQTPNEAQAHADYQLAQTNAESSYPRVLPVTTAQVNNFLAARVISMAGADEPLYRPKFVRAFIIPGNGSLQFFIEEKLGNLTVYIQLVQSPVVSGNTVAFETVGGAIGRLPVHPKLMPLVQRVAGPIQASVGEALGTLKNISGVAINPTGIVVSWPGSAAAKTP